MTPSLSSCLPSHRLIFPFSPLSYLLFSLSTFPLFLLLDLYSQSFCDITTPSWRSSQDTYAFMETFMRRVVNLQGFDTKNTKHINYDIPLCSFVRYPCVYLEASENMDSGLFWFSHRISFLYLCPFLLSTFPRSRVPSSHPSPLASPCAWRSLCLWHSLSRDARNIWWQRTD